MPLSSGDKLGVYEIVGPIGEGGMGEVYRARDTRLDRTVAVKVSKADFGEWFAREAKSVAALNHPNICTLHDVGPNYLVMEYIEGTPLKGPLPLDRAVEYASQVLDALDAAHRKGLVHHDLKPANVLVTRQGIKLLDFGLARRTTPIAANDDTHTAVPGDGQITGTPRYMAPEQLQGKRADARSDLFSFGCLLYELISGKPAFDGESTASVVAAILEREPPVLNLAPPLERVIRRCLAKEPDERFQSARDLKTALLWASETVPPELTAQPNRNRWAIPLAAGLLFGLLVAAAGYLLFRPGKVTPQVSRTIVHPSIGNGLLAISPDGRTVAWTAPGTTFVRNLDQLQPRKFDSDAPSRRSIFFSPDSRSLGIVTNNSLNVQALTDGTIAKLATIGPEPLGAHWGDGNRIVFRPSDGQEVNWVSGSGGAVQKIAGAKCSVPHLLPESDWILCAELLPGRGISSPNNFAVVAVNSRTGENRKLGITGTSPRFVEPGYLVFRGQDGVYAAGFDRTKPAVLTDPVRLVENVRRWDVSLNGTLAYTLGSSFDEASELLRIDRGGKPTAVGSANQPLSRIALSPDGRRALLNTGSIGSIWMYDFDRAVLSRATSEGVQDESPVWSPDGKRFAYASRSSNETVRVLIRTIDGGVPDEEVWSGKDHTHVSAWTPDGGSIFFTTINDQTSDIWVATRDGRWTVRPWLKTPFREEDAVVSADGQWVAYRSNESGNFEVYVQSVKGAGKVQVSTKGQASLQSVAWSRDGRELYYLSSGNLMVVPVNLRNGFQPKAPIALFETNFRFLEPTLDGGFLAAGRPTSSSNAELWIVQNWVEEIKQKIKQ